MKISLSRRSGNRLLFLVFLAVLVMLCMAMYAVLVRFKPVFEQKARHCAKIKATEVINSSISGVFEDCDSGEFVDIQTDTNGKIISVSADTAKMNALRSKIAEQISENASAAHNSCVYIPVGSLTKFPVLQGIGYRIPVKVSLDAVPKIDFDDEFVNAGINQVKHRIYLTADAEFSVVSAVMTMTENVSAQIPVAETVIVGDVPQYYGDKLGVIGK